MFNFSGQFKEGSTISGTAITWRQNVGNVSVTTFVMKSDEEKVVNELAAETKNSNYVCVLAVLEGAKLVFSTNSLSLVYSGLNGGEPTVVQTRDAKTKQVKRNTALKFLVTGETTHLEEMNGGKGEPVYSVTSETEIVVKSIQLKLVVAPKPKVSQPAKVMAAPKRLAVQAPSQPNRPRNYTRVVPMGSDTFVSKVEELDTELAKPYAFVGAMED